MKIHDTDISYVGEAVSTAHKRNSAADAQKIKTPRQHHKYDACRGFLIRKRSAVNVKTVCGQWGYYTVYAFQRLCRLQ